MPFRPLRRMVDRTGALQRGCVGVAVRVGVELTVAVGVREAESVADDDELEDSVEVDVCEDGGVLVPVHDCELLDVPVLNAVLVGVSVLVVDPVAEAVPVDAAVNEPVEESDGEKLSEEENVALDVALAPGDKEAVVDCVPDREMEMVMVLV